jgi:beta-propeller uncharacterized protein DUF5122
VSGGRCGVAWLVVLGLVGGCGDNREPEPAPPDASQPLASPTDVMASDGTSVAVVSVTWTAVPDATSYRVWRDGVVLAEVVAAAYDDATAAAGGGLRAPVLMASAGTFSDRVELTWTPATGDPGASYQYVVTALRGGDESAPSTPDRGFRGGEAALGYEVSTDGGLSFPISTTQTSYSDAAAPAGTLTPGAVTASDGTFDTHVAVALTGATSADGASVSYAVRAITATGSLTSNVVAGHRGVGSITCEWHRHVFGEGFGENIFVIAGATATSFDDPDAAGARLYGYDCTITAPGAASITTTPDTGWRAARANETPRTDTWVTNGEVRAIAAASDTIYIGGNFNYVGPPTGAFAALDATTGAATLLPARVQAPFVNGGELGVTTAIQDAAGRWYVGGDFSAVSGVPQARIARLTATGQLDRTFAPVVLDGDVRSIAVGANSVFVAGSFTSVGFQSRAGFAAFDITTGALTPFSPILTAPPSIPVFINSMFTSGNLLFVGGSFTTIDGVARTNAAAIDLASGSITSWNPRANGSVSLIALSGTTLYVGGGFSQIGGQPRDRIAAIDTRTALATAFNPAPDVDGFLSALVTNGTTVFVAGTFKSIGGQNRRGFAALDATTGAALSFQAEPIPFASSVEALALRGNTLYVGGDFPSIGVQPRTRLAALDATTGALQSWAPIAPRPVHSLSVVNDTVFVGGAFTSAAGRQQRSLAAIDRATGAVTSFDANVDRPVNALVLSGSALYAGGEFTTIGGQPRTSLAQLDRTTGAATSWTADANPRVLDLFLAGGTLYVAGEFNTIAGQTRTGLAALDATTAALSTWAPVVNNVPSRIVVDDGTAYIAGDFTTIDGQPRNRLGAIDASTGQVLAWTPDPNGGVAAIAVAGSTLYVGGGFTTIAGQPRANLASFDRTSTALSGWIPDATASTGVFGLAIAGNAVYATGFFAVGTRPFDSVGALDTTTGKAFAWYPWWFGIATRFIVDGNVMIAGGGMRHVAGYPRQGIAIFDL